MPKPNGSRKPYAKRSKLKISGPTSSAWPKRGQPKPSGPWEEDDAAAEPVAIPVAPEPVVLPPVEVAQVRLPSSVPAIMGQSTRKLPWMAKVEDFKAMVIWIGKQAEAGETRWLECLEPASVKLNSMAKEHTTSLGQIIPGVVGYQGETLARS